MQKKSRTHLARAASQRVKAREFLTELANLRLEVVKRIGLKVNALTPLPWSLADAKREGYLTDRDLEPFYRFMRNHQEKLPYQLDFRPNLDAQGLRKLKELQSRLQVVWRAPDSRSRVFGFHWILHGLGTQAANDESFSVPVPTTFEAMLYELIRDSDLAKVCPNPECPAPYFFAVRRSQRFCSDVCAAPAQREAKLRWWNEKGKEKRAKRIKRRTKRNG